MKRFKTLFIMAAACVVSAVAQVPEPVVGVSFKNYDGSTTEKTYERYCSYIQLNGSDAAEHTFGVSTTKASFTSTADIFYYKDPTVNKFVAHVNNTAGGYIWVKYNNDDALGTAFANGGTWEILFRLSSFEAHSYSTADKQSSARATKIFSSQQGGGWSLIHDPYDGIKFQYVTMGGDANSSGIITTLAPGIAKTGINTYDYYHVVVTVDRSSKTMKMYINGEEKTADTYTASYTNKAKESVSSETNEYLGTDYAYQHPNIGNPKRNTNMWFCLGCDPGTQEEPTGTGIDNSCRASFVFANYYSDVLTADQVAAKANATNVTKLTHPAAATNTSDLMWDVLPGAGNTVTDQSPYHTIAKKGTLTTVYNSTFKRYEVVNSTPTSGNFAYRDYFSEHSILKRLANNMAIEFYCKSNVASPTATTTPMSFQQDGGFGIEFRPVNPDYPPLDTIKFNYNNYGYRTSKGGGGGANLHLATNPSFPDMGYHHYIATVDNVTGKSYIYRDGELIKDYTAVDDMTLQKTYFPQPSYQWFCFNGDVKANRNSSCDFPFDGNIVFGRVWGKTLTAADAAALSAQAAATSLDVTVGANKVTTAIFPFAAVVPAGVKAYVVNTISSGEANTVLYASPGEVIPYGTPVLLYGAAGSYTFNAADLTSAAVKAAPAKNLLTGSYASKVAEADQISVLRADGTGFETAAEDDEVAPLKAWLPAGDVVLRGDIPVVKFDESYDIAGLASYEGEDVDFTFTRSFTKDVASTVCLPFAVSSVSGGTLYSFTGISEVAGEYVVNMSSVAGTPTTANTPYLFMPSATGEVTFSGTTTVPASVEAGNTTNGDWTFEGTYEKTTWSGLPVGSSAVYGFAAKTQNTISPGDFVKLKMTGEAYTPAFRAVMKYTGGASARSLKGTVPTLPSRLKVVLTDGNGNVTEIGSLEILQEQETWFTIDGKELQAKPTKRGIYIRNGKKVFVK